MGGIPETFATRLATWGVTTFALGYFGAPGLLAALIEIPLELSQRGIELFSDRWASERSVGLVGVSKGAELALLLASQLPDLIGPTVAVVPSNVVWYGIGPPDLSRLGEGQPPSSVAHSMSSADWLWLEAWTADTPEIHEKAQRIGDPTVDPRGYLAELGELVLLEE